MSKVLLVAEKEVAKLRSVVGSSGSILNPIQDKAGNWFISYEEVNSPEFAKFFHQDEKIAITDKLVEIDHNPKDAIEFPTKQIKK
jgi:hypothetical protein